MALNGMPTSHGWHVQLDGVCGNTWPIAHGLHLRHAGPLAVVSFVYPSEVRHINSQPVRDQKLLHVSSAPQLAHCLFSVTVHGTVSRAPLQSAHVPHNASVKCVPVMAYSSPALHANGECCLQVSSMSRKEPAGHCSAHDCASSSAPALTKTLPSYFFVHA
jgi:hypothetical protein